MSDILTCTHRRYIAYCVEPGCHCLDRAGIYIESPDQAPTGYEVIREEGLCPACQADHDADPEPMF